LGVPLSKRLVEAHGGRMWLESIAGVGTTIYFTLPLAPGSAHARYSAANANAALPSYRKTVLVLERDPLLLRILHRHLSHYDVIAVEPLADLGTLIAQHQPLALIVNTDGGAADSILAHLPKDLPVIRFTLVGALRAAQLMGVQDYLIKPILREQLLNSVTSLDQTVQQVLVVDDDPESVELLGRMLQSAGEAYQVIKVFGGAEALARLRSERIDLKLLDLSMPEMDGIRERLCQ
jgi:CheY-like chemotaxis protein